MYITHAVTIEHVQKYISVTTLYQVLQTTRIPTGYQLVRDELINDNDSKNNNNNNNNDNK